MKKLLSMMAYAAMGVMLFTACDDDNDTPYVPTPVTVAEGVFVLNAGNAYSNIDGSLTYINSTTGEVTQNAFAAVNGRSLGGTPNDIVVYGSKLYIVCTDENTVEVADVNTLKSVKQIKTTELMGAEKGLQPRHLLAAEGKVYVSAYGTTAQDGSTTGFVAAIDTASYAATTYAVGAYPEGMTYCDGKVYVANSSYGYGIAPSISTIDVASGTVATITDELITNPVSLCTMGSTVYILDSGLYDANWNQSGQGVRKLQGGHVTKIADATMMAGYYSKLNDGVAAEAYIYTVNSPYTIPATTVTYGVYNATAGSEGTFCDGSAIESPCAIAADPVTGHVYITSYVMGQYGYANYSAAGYVCEYSADGTFVKRYEAGVGPSAMAFKTSVRYE